ncbi:hypothetical protein PI23P_05982 [Polaribacter irgensii 23-P]|uniref:Uncharacterized protein n=1 Tax=Polaribacter irgensii 23-P TaxID=313594 RepID=A4BYI3_9FLAO|nr:hypothetical protein [Polaribacter irgensii]EAR14024.1 hypothetical protein PI23P_05982 [Polaribacter irgensii 23-P]
MKIKFKKKRLYVNLILGFVWIGLGIFSLLEDESLRWTDYGYLLAGFLYLGHYLYDLNNQYLTIENGTIRKNALYGFRKKIELNDINSIKKFAGDYTLKTETKELKINTELIDEKSLVELNRILAELNLSSEKNTICEHRV